MHAKRPIVTRFAASTVLGAMLCLNHASLVQAQNALGNGRALDANLQKGSHGTNAKAQTRNFGAGNDLITGNVPGLGYFHGNVGYGASGSFGSRLGSDDLFRFRARSLSSTPSQAPQGAYTLRQTSVFRSHSNASAGDLQRVSGPAVPYGSGGLVIRPSESLATRATRLTAPPDAKLNDAYQDRIGLIRQPEGRLLEVTASPLLGVRHHQVDLTLQPLDTASPDQEPSDTPTHTDAETDVEPPRFYLPGVALGRHLQDTMDSQASSETNLPTDQLVIELESQLFQPVGENDAQADQQDAYERLLTQIKQDRQDAQPIPDQPNPDRDDTQRVPAPLKDPTLRQSAAAEARWRSARQRITALPGGSQEKRARSSEPFQTLLNKLDYNLPRIATLAGKKDTLINQLLLKAQKQLQAERYFDAQEHYRHVLQLQPDDPMGRVGLLHAQIGAGMFRSAYVNLRSLFEKHPELIAARYEASLLPNNERLIWINSELKKTLESTKQAESALILAYLGYQTDTPKVVKYALNMASSKMPHDPVLSMLRRIWIDAEVMPVTAEPDDAQTESDHMTESHSK